MTVLAVTPSTQRSRLQPRAEHLRLQFEAVDLFVRQRPPWLSFLLSLPAGWFAPAQSDAVVRRHFQATR